MLGEALVTAGHLTRAELDYALRFQQHLKNYSGQHKRLGDVLIEQKLATQEQVLGGLRQCGNLEDATATLDIPLHIRRRLGVQVHGVQNGVLQVSATRPLHADEENELLRAADFQGQRARSVGYIAKASFDVLRSISADSVDPAELARTVERFNFDPTGDHSVNSIIDALLLDACQQRASDVHIVTSGLLTRHLDRCLVSYRIDGRLTPKHLLTPESSSILASKVKERSGMDFAQNRLPSDGRTEVTYSTRKVDIRVASEPQVGGGESLVLRLLDPHNLRPLDSLFCDLPLVRDNLRRVAAMQQKRPGLLLVTGPTGSGKTTTLYAVLQTLDRLALNVMTLEDPVEYEIPNVRQTQINEAIGLTYAKTLRSLMRQDPDVIVIGEIRDEETAEYAVRAAETGHLVMSTLHTGSVAESLSRMVDQVPPGFRRNATNVIARNLTGVVNQVLTRRLCDCARETLVGELTGHEQAVASRCGLTAEDAVHVACGCDRCGGTGYIGRVQVPEALFIPADSAVRLQIASILSSGEATEAVIRLPSLAEHYLPRETALRQLLLRGLVDLTSAADTLGTW